MLKTMEDLCLICSSSKDAGILPAESSLYSSDTDPPKKSKNQNLKRFDQGKETRLKEQTHLGWCLHNTGMFFQFDDSLSFLQILN